MKPDHPSPRALAIRAFNLRRAFPDDANLASLEVMLYWCRQKNWHDDQPS